MKGLSVNLSNSGLSLTTGIRGASVTFGKKGTYLNTGIPGTGIYNRTKISSPSTSTNRSSSHLSSDSSSQAKVSINLDEKGSPVLSIKDLFDKPITDESLIRKIKRSEKYKESVEKLMQERKEEIENEANKFISIYKYTPQIIDVEFIINELLNLKAEEYTIKAFEIPKPTKDEIFRVLQIEAKQSIRKLFFWKNKKLRYDYVNDNIELRLAKEVEKWENLKSDFINKEKTTKIQLDDQYKNDFFETKLHLENYLNGESSFVNGMIEKLINEITLPVEFSLDYEYNFDSNNLFIDLDLPEINDLPKEKVNTLASGKISIKNKTQKELNCDYAHCVCGLAFYFAGTFFNISRQIQEIIISGYTLRLNTVNGKDENQYIYSVKFKRDKFGELNIKEIEPSKAFSNFEYKMALNNNFEFKVIEPLHN